MPSLTSIVDSEISLSATPVPLASFQTMAVMASFQTWAERIRYYDTDTYQTAMVADGFTTADPAYKMVNACFVQPNPPTQVAVIRRDAGDADWVAALSAVKAVDNTWYGFCVDTRLLADILAIAGWAQGAKKLYGALSNDVAIGGSGNADICSQLQALNYDRTWVQFHDATLFGEGQYLDCAWMAFRLTQQPGSNTWKFSKLVGITPDNLSDTFIQNAEGKNCNLFLDYDEQGITEQGVCASGLFIDLRVGADWLSAVMQNRLFTYMLQTSQTGKVSLTDNGLTGMEQQIRSSLRTGVDVNFLTDEQPITVNMPTRLTLSDADRANRRVTGITWQAFLADAAHSAVIRGVVTA